MFSGLALARRLDLAEARERGRETVRKHKACASDRVPWVGPLLSLVKIKNAGARALGRALLSPVGS